MTSFNQFKNNTQILKKYLSKMHAISQSQIKPAWIQQNFLKQNNPHIFLQILHYVLIKFSPFVLFVKILDYYPTIKDDSDKKFVTNVMAISRKMFQIDVKIDIDQFLSNKFVEKKTQFTSMLCKAAYEYHLKQNKQNNTASLNTKTNKKQIQNTTSMPAKLSHKYQMDEDSDDQMPRNLNVAPSSTNNPNKKNLKITQSSSDQDFKQLMNKKKQLTKIKQNSKPSKNMYQQEPQIKFKTNEIKKANIFPKSVSRNSDEQQNQFYDSQRFKIDNKKTVQKYVINNKTDQKFLKGTQQKQKKIQKSIRNNSTSTKNHYQIDQQEGIQYVSRQQFMQIITGMSRNITQLLGKFNDFQSQVGGWVQNINAKISILQQNVRTIKNNL